MNTVRRQRLAVPLVAAVLVALHCGDNTAVAAPAGYEVPTTPPTTDIAGTDAGTESAGSEPADDPASADELGLRAGWDGLLDALRCSDTSVGTFPRAVVHDGGETVIETEPQRVVSIEGTTSLDMLLLMGVTPAASGGDYDGPAVANFQAYLSGGTPQEPGYALFPKRPEINVEAIAAARPDLIISQSGWIEDIIDPVSAIGAPVVVFDWTDDKVDWRDNVRIVGEAIGRDACVDEIIGKVEAQIVDTRSSLEAAGTADDTFTVFTALEGYIAHHGSLDPVGKAIVEELGLTLEPSDGSQTEFSLELA